MGKIQARTMPPSAWSDNIFSSHLGKGEGFLVKNMMAVACNHRPMFCVGLSCGTRGGKNWLDIKYWFDLIWVGFVQSVFH